MAPYVGTDDPGDLEDVREISGDLSLEERESLFGQFRDMDYFLSTIPASLAKLSAKMSSFGIINGDIDELRNACSSLRQVLNQLKIHVSHVKRYNRESMKDKTRVHRNLDYLTYVMRMISTEMMNADTLDQYKCLRAWMALNLAMETRFDEPGWMDDCSCQRRLLECKEMLLNCCDDEYVHHLHLVN